MTCSFIVITIIQAIYLALHPQYPWYAPSASAPITAIFPVAFGKRTPHGWLQEWLWMSATLLVVGNVAYWMTRLTAFVLT